MSGNIETNNKNLSNIVRISSLTAHAGPHTRKILRQHDIRSGVVLGLRPLPFDELVGLYIDLVGYGQCLFDSGFFTSSQSSRVQGVRMGTKQHESR